MLGGSASPEGAEAELVVPSFDDLFFEPAAPMGEGMLALPQHGSMPKYAPPGDQGTVWRCLNAAHLMRPCSSCTAPPDEVEADMFELVGDPGKKNGEKKLRSLISRSPEWCDKELCRALAAELDGLGTASDSRLAQCIRTHHVAELRKSQLLALCRRWKYRSDLWRRRETRKEKQAAAAAAQAAAAAAGAGPAGELPRVKTEDPTSSSIGGASGSAAPMPQALSPHGGSSDLATAMAPVLKEATEASSRGDRLTAQDVAPPAGAILVNPTELGVLTQTVLDISKAFSELQEEHVNLIDFTPLPRLNMILAEKEETAKSLRKFTCLMKQTAAGVRQAWLGGDQRTLAVVALKGHLAPFDSVLMALGDLAASAPDVFSRALERIRNIPLLAGIVTSSERWRSMRETIDNISCSVLELVARMQVLHSRAKLGTVQEYLDVVDNLQLLLGMFIISLVESLEYCCGQLRARGAVVVAAAHEAGIFNIRFSLATAASSAIMAGGARFF